MQSARFAILLATGLLAATTIACGNKGGGAPSGSNTGTGPRYGTGTGLYGATGTRAVGTGTGIDGAPAHANTGVSTGTGVATGTGTGLYGATASSDTGSPTATSRATGTGVATGTGLADAPPTTTGTGLATSSPASTGTGLATSSGASGTGTGFTSVEALAKAVVEVYDTQDEAKAKALFPSDALLDKWLTCSSPNAGPKGETHEDLSGLLRKLGGMKGEHAEYVSVEERGGDKKTVAKGTSEKGCTANEDFEIVSLRIKYKTIHAGKSADDTESVTVVLAGGKWYVVDL